MTSPAVELARSAADGDERAWQQLVTRFEPFLRSVLRTYRLDRSDVDDVLQTTWLRALLHLHQLAEPAALGSWLAVTARREALRVLQRDVREVLTGTTLGVEDPDWQTAEAVVIERERRRAIRTAARRLRGRQRLLVRALLDRPGVSYEELSAVLDMPIGSIGPTRERAFTRMRRDSQLVQVISQ